jgi:uncharacterized protein YqhQ
MAKVSKLKKENIKNKNVDCNTSRVGGQALLEGVMMRYKNRVAYSARLEKSGKIVSKVEDIHPLSEKYKFLKWPFIRGTYNLFSSLIIGMNALSWSANAQIEKKNEKISSKEMGITIAISLVIAIAVFVMLPLFLAKLVIHQNGFLFNLIDGMLRVLIFVIYIFIISSMKDVKRLFMYHGAEHKSVYCYENKLPLTVANAKKFSRLHPRCGTNFVVIVLFVMVFLHTFIYSNNFFLQFGFRLLLLPVIAGVSYELLMVSFKHNNFITKGINQFGFLFQRLTTKEPDDKMIEVALKSIKLAVVSKS